MLIRLTTLNRCRRVTEDQQRNSCSVRLLRLNGIWGLANLVCNATANSCIDVYNRLSSQDGGWLDLLRSCSASSCSSEPPELGYINLVVRPRDVTRRRRFSDSSLKPPMLGDARSTRIDHAPSLQVLTDSTTDEDNGVRISTMDDRLSSCSEEPQTAEKVHSASSEFAADRLILYQTLAFLRNLLRHDKVCRSPSSENRVPSF